MEARNIPLFPLRIVLFPHMLLPLHIFEERYKRMIEECWAGDRTFGVILSQEGNEVEGTTFPFPVGTTAYIEDLVHLDRGRMNLVAVGQERFRIVQITQRKPFLRANIRALQDQAADPASLLPLVERTSDLARKYIQLLLQRAGRRPQQMDLPTDPQQLSFVLSSSLQVDMRERQALLELTDTRTRLEQLEQLLQRETTRLQQGLAEQQAMDDVKGGNGKLDHSLLPRAEA